MQKIRQWYALSLQCSNRTLRFISVVAAGLFFLIASWLATSITAWQLADRLPLQGLVWQCPAPWNRYLFGTGLLLVIGAVGLCLKARPMRLAMGLSGVGLVITLFAVTPFYNPLAIYHWYGTYANNPMAQGHWWPAMLLIGSAIVACLLLGLFVNLHQQKTPTSDVYGSSHWATPLEIHKSGLIEGEDAHAVYVGAWEHPQTKTMHYLRSSGPEHVFVYAPTRSGKGVGLVIPTLLSYRGSTIDSDFKLENWQLTAGWRRSIGHTVLKLEPTCTNDTGARFNPLLEVRQGLNEVRDAQNIADMLVNPDGRNKGDHWSNAANSLLVSTILHVLYAERDKSLAGVRNFLANPHRTEEDTLTLMLSTLHDPTKQFGWIDAMTGQTTSVHPLVASGAREMLNKSEGERTSIVSTALTFLKVYRDPIIALNTSTSDFTIADLIFGDQPVDLYLGIPPSDIARIMPYMRLVLNQILSRLTESMDFTQGKNGTADRHPLLLMLDEFPQFGRLPFFEKALAYIAGYGIRAFLITQDLTQLYAEYGHQQSITANCHLKTAYAPNTLETAHHISEFLGPTTAQKHNVSYSGGRFDFLLKHKAISEQEVKKPLLAADELLRLEAHRAIVFRSGHYPIDGNKIFYYSDPTFSERSKIAAPLCSDRLKAIYPWTAIINGHEADQENPPITVTPPDLTRPDNAPAISVEADQLPDSREDLI